MGDALVESKGDTAARSVWREGIGIFPDSTRLAERLGVEGDRPLLDLVEDRRSLERPIDTDFAFLF